MAKSSIGQNIGPERVIKPRTGGAKLNEHDASGSGLKNHMGKFNEERKNLGQNIGKEKCLTNRPYKPLDESTDPKKPSENYDYDEDDPEHSSNTGVSASVPGRYSSYLGHFAKRAVLAKGHNNIGKY